MSKDKKTPKAKGPIRWEAIIPIAIIYVLVSLYTKLFFDTHLRWALETAGYYAIGAEVNIGSVQSSFFKGSIRIQNIQLTNAEKPTHNSIEIGDVRFSALWDALLRGKLVINEVAVEQIALDTTRKRPGKVKPPEPPKTGPGAAEKLKSETLALIEKQNQNNVLSDITAVLGGGSSQAQLDELKQKIVSKEKLAAFEKDLKAKESLWKEKIAALPSAKEAKAIQDRISKVKTKDFKTPQELEKSLKELDSAIKDANKEIQKIQAAEKDLKADIGSTESGFKDIEKQIAKDIQDLQAHFKIPKLEAAEITKSIFMGYLSPYAAKAYGYKDMAEKYLPPKFKQGDDAKESVKIQPRPRENGVSYEFGRPNSYPLVWVKRVGISSESRGNKMMGDLAGEITHITSHPRLIMKPTTLNVAGNFPGLGLSGMNLKVALDITGPESLVETLFKLDSYPLPETSLVKNKDVEMSMQKAQGSLNVQAKLTSFKSLDYRIKNTFADLTASAKATNKEVDEVLNFVLNDIKSTDLEVWGRGDLPLVPLNIKSDLGDQIAKGFERKLQARIAEAQAQLKAFVDAEINKQKQAVQAQLNQFKSQAEGEIKKLQAQFESQKKAIQNQIDQAKKDTENKAKAEANKEKKKIEEEAKKKANELKKKLGF